MIYKRHLLVSGPPGGLAGSGHLDEKYKKFLKMGEDEEKEVLPTEVSVSRDLWKKRLEIK